MTSYRPICDTWILARPKGQRIYGAFPSGFYWRMRAMLPGFLCHLCSGSLGPEDDNNARFVDKTRPAWAEGLAELAESVDRPEVFMQADATATRFKNWVFDSVMIDPPYSPGDAMEYGHDYPEPKDLLKEAWRIVRPGGRVGFLHYLFPRPPAKDCRLVATISVLMGYGNRVRLFTVFEKPNG